VAQQKTQQQEQVTQIAQEQAAQISAPDHTFAWPAMHSVSRWGVAYLNAARQAGSPAGACTIASVTPWQVKNHEQYDELQAAQISQSAESLWQMQQKATQLLNEVGQVVSAYEALRHDIYQLRNSLVGCCTPPPHPVRAISFCVCPSDDDAAGRGGKIRKRCSSSS
jgi:hypothetical protein